MQVKATIVAFPLFTLAHSGGFIGIPRVPARVRCAAQSLASGRKPRAMNTRIPFGIAGGRDHYAIAEIQRVERIRISYLRPIRHQIPTLRSSRSITRRDSPQDQLCVCAMFQFFVHHS